mmetsp:Transcript_7034/g.8737  ORF Transcript_7034/g.8737 Transcript_7034/m.8737 type:complete len:184 (-) Transcript_7034:890-1441(-)
MKGMEIITKLKRILNRKRYKTHVYVPSTPRGERENSEIILQAEGEWGTIHDLPEIHKSEKLTSSKRYQHRPKLRVQTKSSLAPSRCQDTIFNEPNFYFFDRKSDKVIFIAPAGRILTEIEENAHSDTKFLHFNKHEVFWENIVLNMRGEVHTLNREKIGYFFEHDCEGSFEIFTEALAFDYET